MIELATDNLLASLSNVSLMGAKMRHALDGCEPGLPDISIEDPKHFFLLRASLQVIEEQATKVGMPVTLAAVWRCNQIMPEFRNWGTGLIIRRNLLENLCEYLYTLNQVFSDEINSHKVFVINSKHSAFYSAETATFGKEVEDAFPSAYDEILEAGKCRALGRWTACVMHLMRALEPALLALQIAVDVDVPKEQWDQILNQINAKIKEITKRSHGAADEQWFSEAASHFRLIKNAWRNHAQHLHERYDEERTVAIYDSVRAFMRHLAMRLKEDE